MEVSGQLHAPADEVKIYVKSTVTLRTLHSLYIIIIIIIIGAVIAQSV
jgi:hypothetical protein